LRAVEGGNGDYVGNFFGSTSDLMDITAPRPLGWGGKYTLPSGTSYVPGS
jgi:hypothetical protein